METDRSKLCGCKGIRTCLTCEKVCGLPSKTFSPEENELAYVFCPLCNKCWPGWDLNEYQVHPNHKGEPFYLEGIYVALDFLSEEEEQRLINDLDTIPWELSQSGRRKQNFGPKCNFKKRKLNLGNFQGFPKCSSFVQEKFTDINLLQNYMTIEQCSLEYDPVRGASIDPHIDDCWIWGERIVTVNVLGDAVLTMKPYTGDDNKYNLKLAPSRYLEENKVVSKRIVRVPMPRRSLIILYGEARYIWEHFVCREDITERRVCLAYREFTPEYLPGGKFEDETKDILEKAKPVLLF